MDFELAFQIAQRMLEADTGMAMLHRYILVSELIFCELIGENRPDKLKQYRTEEFKKFEKSMKNFISLIRMQYAYELLAYVKNCYKDKTQNPINNEIMVKR